MVSFNVNSNRQVVGQNKVGNNVKTNKKNKNKYIGASVAAAGVSKVGSLASTPLGYVSNKGIVQASKQLSTENKALMNEAADKILADSGLAKKGVEIFHIASAPPNLSSLPDNVYDMINPYASVANGKNAFFFS